MDNGKRLAQATIFELETGNVREYTGCFENLHHRYLVEAAGEVRQVSTEIDAQDLIA